MNGIVYLLEDDEGISKLVEMSLSLEGVSVKTFPTVKAFKEGLGCGTPDVALLDIMLPDGNGFEVLEYVKTRYTSVCCIMLSALSQETDKVKGLNLGADDYIAKPFGVMELVARVKAALRRRVGRETLEVGDIRLDGLTMSVTLRGEPVELNRKEFELLRYCMKNVDLVLSREVLLTEIWGYVDGETRTLDNHVARLRKLGFNNFETVFGVGYRFRKQSKNENG